MSLQASDQIGRYEIQAEIGQGSFGKVYRAWDPEFERQVAIKELSKERETHNLAEYEEYLARFKLERRIQGQFQHPNIVSVYDMVQQDENEYLIEEYVDGGTLRDWLHHQGEMTPEQVVQIGTEMCQAIAPAWEQDVVHRDIKPSNILLTKDGHAKLNDFGVAQIGQMSQRTQSSTLHPGTPAYKSPEQERISGYLDERSDLYTLGLVLYEALTNALYKRERIPVHFLNPDVPKRLSQAIMHALEESPNERYQHASEFETALQESLKKRYASWLFWVGSAFILAGLIFVGYAYNQMRPPHVMPALTPTFTQTPSPIPTSNPASPTTSPAQTTSPTVTATPRPSVTPKPTYTLALETSAEPKLSAPWLQSPPGGTSINAPNLTLSWNGTVPNENFGFRVLLEHNSRNYLSPIMNAKQWSVNLPGNQTWGEWHWSVGIVDQNTPNRLLVPSEKWTFYYAPFGGGPSKSTPPVISPLSTPFSPAATPKP